MDKDEDDIAVSEVVGYVIIAGIILTSISIAYVNGYPALQDVRDHERQSSVASAFSVMGDNIQELANGGSIKRQTEMNLIDDSLGVDSDRRSWIEVSIENASDELCTRRCNVSIDPIVYENSAQGITNERAPGPSGSQVTTDQIVYENGAVIRDPGGTRSGMHQEPDWVVEDEGVIINVIATRGGNTVTGDGTFSVFTEHRSSDSIVEDYSGKSDDLDVTVTVGTENPLAWATYMDGMDEVDNVVPEPQDIDENTDNVTMYVNGTEKVIRKRTIVDAEAR